VNANQSIKAEFQGNCAGMNVGISEVEGEDVALDECCFGDVHASERNLCRRNVVPGDVEAFLMGNENLRCWDARTTAKFQNVCACAS
jgi:hypothetical protein